MLLWGWLALAEPTCAESRDALLEERLLLHHAVIEAEDVAACRAVVATALPERQAWADRCIQPTSPLLRTTNRRLTCATEAATAVCDWMALPAKVQASKSRREVWAEAQADCCGRGGLNGCDPGEIAVEPEVERGLPE